MKYSPMRRAQLIAPFGVGAMFTAPDGTGMITAGLEGWFDPADGANLDVEEYVISEWRLEPHLKVSQLRLPPDHRRPVRGQEESKNKLLTVPSLLFPLWHFCPSSNCRALVELKPHYGKRRRCTRCENRIAASGSKGKAPFLAQVPFIALCPAGHLEDFPWREWLHRETSPNCERQMFLKSTGGATLASQVVSCECGVTPRNLSGITSASADGTTLLSEKLAPGDEDLYLCRGRRPWVDDRAGEGCGLHLRGSLRASTATYYAHMESAIYLPGGVDGLPEGLVEAFDRVVSPMQLAMLRQIDQLDAETVMAADEHGDLAGFELRDIQTYLDSLDEGRREAQGAGDQPVDASDLRSAEYEVLRNQQRSEDLVVRPQEPSTYSGLASDLLTRINLVEKLRETRVMYGFSRVEPDNSRRLKDLKALLWKTEPEFSKSWLPAYVVHGEGIFLEFDETAVQSWERRPDVLERTTLLREHPQRTRAHQGLEDPDLVPRFVLLHTFAHLLINQLVFECGYSSASLRERLFCARGDHPMAGLLIYTAAGDSEGTMGGLVRMGKAGKLEPAITAALDRARWCSSDPVCMELGGRGQGPKSMNLAACHACGLLPETACEAFNVFLDRAMVTGTHENPSMGFLTGTGADPATSELA